MTMIQCRACEFIQPEGDACKRCGRVFHAPAIPSLPVEVVQPGSSPKKPCASELPRPKTLAELERDAIATAIASQSPREAAKALGIGASTIYRKMRLYGLSHTKEEKR